MRILITNIDYSDLTGSVLYTYELSRTLVELGHEVDILTTRLGGLIEEKTKPTGVGMYVDIPDKKYDVIHYHHKPLIEAIIDEYRNTPSINVIHSEYISPFEDPVIHKAIKKYVIIRPSIEEKLLDFGINRDDILTIYNPIDQNRFHCKKRHERDRKQVLFVGSKDFLREKVIEDLKEMDCDLLTVGRGFDNPPQWDVENYIYEADETAGIFMGRTTLESWMCDRPSWIYQVDGKGNILSKRLHQPPNDLYKFDRYFVANQFIKLYESL